MKPTLTIGIPAYNEEKSIGVLLASIFDQEQTNYKLEKVLVVIDKSTDKTSEVVTEFSRKYKQIHVITQKKRKGKAEALNVIYANSNSDYLLTIDADTFFDSKRTISKLITRFKVKKDLNLVGARHKPIMPKSFMGRCATYSYLMTEDAFLKTNNGNNFYAVMSNELMPKKFYKSFKFPKFTLSDQCYVYAMATKNKQEGFSLVKDAYIKFLPVTTFQDWRILSARSIKGDKQDVVERFGEQILPSYSMKKTIIIKSMLKFLIHSPIYTSGAIAMNIFIRMFPYEKSVIDHGMWTTTLSSKLLVMT